MIIVLTYALLWCCMLAYSAYLRIGKERVGQIATGTLVASWALLTFGLVSRALEEGHWPLANRYEFALCTLWTITSITMLLEKSWRKRHAGTFILAITLLIATYAVTSPESEKVIMPLLPALRTIWLQVHVISAAIAYGAFGVAAGLGFMRLVWENSAVNKTWEGQSVSQEEIERMMERIVSLGFPWLTLGILSGAIWAQNAWGRYWGWDPKETWALVTWLWYLLVLHIRSLRNWRGWRLAGLTTAGFGVVLFTFIGVPWLVRSIRLESLHGF